MQVTTVFDCTGGNLASLKLPPGSMVAGYVTGTDGVAWTSEQFAAYPDAVRIDQAPVATPSDMTADVYDLEAGAGTLLAMPSWVHGAWDSYTTGRRPGQRAPAVYCARSTVTPVVNALLAAGITNGVCLWVAEEMQQGQAALEVETASGPFPVIGVQFAYQSLFDVSEVSTAWLNRVSKQPVIPAPGTETQAFWRFCGKCQGLFYGPGEQFSKCPDGGTHDGSQSHAYRLEYDQ